MRFGVIACHKVHLDCAFVIERFARSVVVKEPIAHWCGYENAIDHRLSGLQGDPWLAQRITAISKGEPPIMKKRLLMSLVLSIAAILVAATALAAGLLFSPRYDASKLANEAMLNKYGIVNLFIFVGIIVHIDITSFCGCLEDIIGYATV